MSWLRFPRVLGIVVCLYLVAMSVLFGLFSNQNNRFVHHAAETQGTVVQLVARAPVGSTRPPRFDDGQSVSVAPKVRYEVGGITYDYVAAHGRFHQPLRVGDAVAVLYDPAAPALARLKGEGSVLVPLITAGFVAAALLVAVVLFRTRRILPTGLRRKSTPVAGTSRPRGRGRHPAPDEAEASDDLDEDETDVPQDGTDPASVPPHRGGHPSARAGGPDRGADHDAYAPASSRPPRS